jgi:hypothetical protein
MSVIVIRWTKGGLFSLTFQFMLKNTNQFPIQSEGSIYWCHLLEVSEKLMKRRWNRPSDEVHGALSLCVLRTVASRQVMFLAGTSHIRLCTIKHFVLVNEHGASWSTVSVCSRFHREVWPLTRQPRLMRQTCKELGLANQLVRPVGQ